MVAPNLRSQLMARAEEKRVWGSVRGEQEPHRRRENSYSLTRKQGIEVSSSCHRGSFSDPT